MGRVRIAPYRGPRGRKRKEIPPLDEKKKAKVPDRAREARNRGRRAGGCSEGHLAPQEDPVSQGGQVHIQQANYTVEGTE